MNFRKQDHLVLTDQELDRVLGAAGATVPDELTLLSARREQLINLRHDLEIQAKSPWANDPMQVFIKHAEAGKELQEVTQSLNDVYAKHHLEEMQRQAHEAELKELEEHERKAQEAEEKDWLKQADAELAAEAAAHQGGGDAGPPANADAGPGQTFPSFPTNIVNPPPSHEPTIVLEPIEQEHRLY